MLSPDKLRRHYKHGWLQSPLSAPENTVAGVEWARPEIFADPNDGSARLLPPLSDQEGVEDSHGVAWASYM